MEANLSVDVVTKIWADCPDGRDLDEFARWLGDELGNPVLAIDRENRRVLMATSEED